MAARPQTIPQVTVVQGQQVIQAGQQIMQGQQVVQGQQVIQAGQQVVQGQQVIQGQPILQGHPAPPRPGLQLDERGLVVGPRSVTPGTAIRPQFNEKAGVVLGSMHLILAGLILIFQLTANIIHSGAHFVGAGYWCSILFLLAGGFGIPAGKYKTTAMIVCFLIFSVLSAVFVIPLLGQASAGLAEDNSPNCHHGYAYDPEEHREVYRYVCTGHGRAGEVAVNAFLVLLALVEGVVGIVSAGFCCAAACCGYWERVGHPPRPRFATNTYTIAATQPQVTALTPQGGVTTYVPTQPQYIVVPQGMPTMTTVQIPQATVQNVQNQAAAGAVGSSVTQPPEYHPQKNDEEKPPAYSPYAQ